MLFEMETDLGGNILATFGNIWQDSKLRTSSGGSFA